MFKFVAEILNWKISHSVNCFHFGNNSKEVNRKGI